MRPAVFDFQRIDDTARYPLDRVNPLVLVVGIVIPAITALTISDLRTALVCVAILVVFLPLIRCRPRALLLRLGVGLFLFLSIAWSNWLLGTGGLESAALAGTRVFCMAAPGLIFSAHVRPFELGDALIQILKLPPRPVLASVMAFQRALFLAEQWTELGKIRRARGLGGASLVGTLKEQSSRTQVFLVIAIRSATELSIAMDIRGMLAWRTKGVDRGFWDASVWHRKDTVVTIVIIAAALVPLALLFF